MKILPLFFTAILLLFQVTACDAQAAIRTSPYDSAANPSHALALAKKQARASGRKVLVIAGGDWCRWCRALEAFIAKNPEVKAALDKNFVIVEVYYGEENLNEAFFSKLPPAMGFPHFWVISGNGKVLHSVETSDIEDGASSYDKARFLSFIQELNKG